MTTVYVVMVDEEDENHGSVVSIYAQENAAREDVERLREKAEHYLTYYYEAWMVHA